MKKTEFVSGFAVAMAIMISLLLLTGAISPKTDNYHEKMKVTPEQASINIACSADGKIVYVADGARVLGSYDFGNNWKIVMTSDDDDYKK